MYTTEEFATLIEDFNGDIKKQVNEIIHKIQQPSPWDFESLQQEAILEAWKKFQSCFDPNKSKPRTFLFLCVKHALYDIMYYSWKKPKLSLVSSFSSEDEESPDFQFVGNDSDFSSSVNTMFEEDTFTEEEKRYIQLIVFPEESLAKKNAENPRRIRINVRDILKIDNDKEYNLRCSIKKKLEKRLLSV